MADTFHLHKRNGTWYYRRRVPQHLVQAFGRPVIQHSLKTTSKIEAKKYREVLDLRWSAEFDRLSRGTVSKDESSGEVSRGQLTEAEALSLIRHYIEHVEERFTRVMRDDGPSSAGERDEMEADIARSLRSLTDPENPRGYEQIHFVRERLLSASDKAVGVAISEDQFDELVRRGILEADRRRMARLRDEYSSRFFDQLFDPKRDPRVSFGELAEQYLSLRQQEGAANGISEKSLDRLRAQVSLVRRLIGDEVEVTSLNYDSCLRARATLATVPANLNKRYPGIPLEQAIERASIDGRGLLSPLTQTQYLAVLSDILDLATKKRLLPVNPAEGLAPIRRDDVSRIDKRAPFSLDQLSRFFSNRFYLECSYTSPPYAADSKGWRFWLPLICLFMGLRPREACQLEAGDLRRTPHGTWFLAVTDVGDDAVSGRRRSVKTASSRRAVPVHPELLRIGFLGYVESRTGPSGRDPIFPNLPHNRYGDPAQYPLKRFNEAYLREVIGSEQKQSFYSFRHSFRDALRRAEASPDVLEALGWSQGGRVASDHYGSRLDPDALSRQLEKVQYPGVSLAHLYVARERLEPRRRATRNASRSARR